MVRVRGKPIRVLHVFGPMDRGGAEGWLMHILRIMDHDRYRMDFLVHVAEPKEYDDEIRALGSNVIANPHTRRPFRYTRELKRVLADEGPYDIVHSHVHQYSGFVLRIAKQAGVPIRIAHSHIDAATAEARASLPRRAYLTLMHRWIKRYATDGLAASRQAADDLFGPNWDADPRFRILPCGVDFDPFAAAACPADVRAEFHIPPGAFVVGHVGRFIGVKNHAFLLDVAAAIVARTPDVDTRFLLVGVGELRAEMKERADRLGIGARVVFAGSRSDVPRLLRGGMDLFLFPSLLEGLGLAVVEAQAAGLPVVFSDVVPREADIVPPLVHRLSLDQSASTWADAVLTLRDAAPPLSPPEALALARATPFDIHTSWAALEHVYARD